MDTVQHTSRDECPLFLTCAAVVTTKSRKKGSSDAIHLVAATVTEPDYLLAWNCRHLANAQILRRLGKEAQARGWRLPTVCTPIELMGDSLHENESNP